MNVNDPLKGKRPDEIEGTSINIYRLFLRKKFNAEMPRTQRTSSNQPPKPKTGRSMKILLCDPWRPLLLGVGKKPSSFDSEYKWRQAPGQQSHNQGNHSCHGRGQKRFPHTDFFCHNAKGGNAWKVEHDKQRENQNLIGR